MKTFKFWYYGTLFMISGYVFDLMLHISDNWDDVQGALDHALYYEAKMEENRIV